MKKLFFIFTFVCSTLTYAATVNDARVNLETGNIEVDVSYGGGCEEHFFSLQMNGCLESFPVQCTATLVHTGEPDFCEAYIQRTVNFSIVEYGLNDSYYDGASINITGSQNSNASVVLPRAE